MTVDPALLIAARKVTAHRPKIVIDHIIKYGFISTEDLKNTYGYNHPPRAACDVRDQGIPLETFKVTGSDGRKIAAYRFGDPSMIEGGKLGGRKILPKQLKKALIDKFGHRCLITSEIYDESYLQIDHRVPYRVAGDNNNTELNPADFMLLSGSAQRQKSWACEHCTNFISEKCLLTCQCCYWAFPERYTHVAMKVEHRIEIVFSGEDTNLHEKVKEIARVENSTIQEEIKKLIRR